MLFLKKKKKGGIFHSPQIPASVSMYGHMYCRVKQLVRAKVEIDFLGRRGGEGGEKKAELMRARGAGSSETIKKTKSRENIQ